MRTIDCKDRERVLRGQDPQELAELERHAQTCAECAGELREWNELSAAARAMRRGWESPSLWPRIERALEAAQESARAGPRRWGRAWGRSRAWGTTAGWGIAWRQWQVAAALFVVLGLSVWGASRWLLRSSAPVAPVTSEDQRRLLTEQALSEVEKSQAAYEASIRKLAAVAAPKIAAPATPRLESYREKLLLLDEAIADCRDQIATNQANPELRRALLSMYHEKQMTLEQLMQE